MITDYFITQCSSYCLYGKSNSKIKKEVYDSIEIIFNWILNEMPKDNDNFIENSKSKIELVYYLSRFKKVSTKEISKEEILGNLKSGKFKNLIEIVSTIPDLFLSELEEEEFFKLLSRKKKICSLVKGKKNIKELLDDIESGNFVDEEEIISRWETNIVDLHSNLTKIKRIESTQKAASLNLLTDDYTPMLNMMRDNLDYKNSLKTGYEYLKKCLPSGGFERGRFYLIGGTSGAGKSTLLMNLICNAINLNSSIEKEQTFLYITAENLITETWARFFCCFLETPYVQLLKDIADDSENVFANDLSTENNEKVNLKYKEMMYQVKTKLKEHNINVIFEYVDPQCATISELDALISNAANNDESNLRAVFIDYLDLFRTGKNLDPRIEHGEVSQAFKNYALSYNVPVISATQLNREGYRPDVTPSLTQMGEAMLKVNNSDLVLFIQNDKTPLGLTSVKGVITEVKRLKLTLLKSRNGDTGDSAMFIMPKKQNEQSIFNYSILESFDLADASQSLSDLLEEDSPSEIE